MSFSVKSVWRIKNLKIRTVEQRIAWYSFSVHSFKSSRLSLFWSVVLTCVARKKLIINAFKHTSSNFFCTILISRWKSKYGSSEVKSPSNSESNSQADKDFILYTLELLKSRISVIFKFVEMGWVRHAIIKRAEFRSISLFTLFSFMLCFFSECSGASKSCTVDWLYKPTHFASRTKTAQGWNLRDDFLTRQTDFDDHDLFLLVFIFSFSPPILPKKKSQCDFYVLSCNKPDLVLELKFESAMVLVTTAVVCIQRCSFLGTVGRKSIKKYSRRKLSRQYKHVTLKRSCFSLLHKTTKPTKATTHASCTSCSHSVGRQTLSRKLRAMSFCTSLLVFCLCWACNSATRWENIVFYCYIIMPSGVSRVER